MNWLIAFLRKWFLVKEIVSSEGVLHFRRWRVLVTPWFRVYIHAIYASDQDKHLHDHPWGFASILLKGKYEEVYAISPHWTDLKKRTFGVADMNIHWHSDAHKITVLEGPVWTLFFTGGKTYDWGYQTEHGWLDHRQYREMKRNGTL